MKSILHGLYRGDIIPWERRGPQSGEYRETLRKTEGGERYFTEKMPPGDRGRFEKLPRLHLELSGAEEDDLFSYAFSLGILLTLDATEEGGGLCPPPRPGAQTGGNRKFAGPDSPGRLPAEPYVSNTEKAGAVFSTLPPR